MGPRPEYKNETSARQHRKNNHDLKVGKYFLVYKEH
jgi:hypothetical protein